jgi:hypothetical protein
MINSIVLINNFRLNILFFVNQNIGLVLFVCFKNLNKKNIENHFVFGVLVDSFTFLLSQASIVAVVKVMALRHVHGKVSEIRLVFLSAFLQLVSLLTAV